LYSVCYTFFGFSPTWGLRWRVIGGGGEGGGRHKLLSSRRRRGRGL